VDKKTKILLAGVPEKNHSLFRKILEKHNYSLSFSHTHKIDISENKLPDIVIALKNEAESFSSDFHELINLCKEKNLPLFVITGINSRKSYVSLIEQGICNIITSPILEKDFLKRISNFNPCCSGDVENIKKIPLDFSQGTENLNIEIEEKKIGPLINSLLINLENQIHFSRENLKHTKKLKDIKKPESKRNRKKREIEDFLWETLDKDNFCLFYQPVMDIDKNTLAGFESLIRINDPERGIISPGEFIETAENSAIIFPLGIWIIDEACRQISLWKQKFNFKNPVRININLSSKQFLHPHLTESIFEITEKYGIEPEDIGFELTESAFMDDMERANLSLLELRSRHFPIYMDDFGTGYSSLSYLMHFPVNIIKIDQSFVKWMRIDESSEKIVKSIISLAHSLDLKVVAEGIEDEEHIGMLRNFQCDYGQGYFFSKPMPADEAEEFIAQYYIMR
jgi:EAL domain-containing protein (putative c-di-GMP-specific phosphodiesterase class I)